MENFLNKSKNDLDAVNNIQGDNKEKSQAENNNSES